MSKQEKILFAFDWNGTLLHDLPAIVTAFGAVQQHCGFKPCSTDQFQEYFDFPLDRWYRNAGFPEELIATKLGEIHRVCVQAYEPLEEVAPLRDGAKEMLSEIADRGFVSAIFSNHFKGRIEAQCARLDISHHFDEILASGGIEEQLTAPPKKERLRLYMERLGVFPERTLIIGDTPEEIHISHEFGATSIALTGGFASRKRLEACKPNYLVSSLSEIPAIASRIFANGGPS